MTDKDEDNLKKAIGYLNSVQEHVKEYAAQNPGQLLFDPRADIDGTTLFTVDDSRRIYISAIMANLKRAFEILKVSYIKDAHGKDVKDNKQHISDGILQKIFGTAEKNIANTIRNWLTYSVFKITVNELNKFIQKVPYITGCLKNKQQIKKETLETLLPGDAFKKDKLINGSIGEVKKACAAIGVLEDRDKTENLLKVDAICNYLEIAGKLCTQKRSTVRSGTFLVKGIDEVKKFTEFRRTYAHSTGEVPFALVMDMHNSICNKQASIDKQEADKKAAEEARINAMEEERKRAEQEEVEKKAEERMLEHKCRNIKYAFRYNYELEEPGSPTTQQNNIIDFLDEPPSPATTGVVKELCLSGEVPTSPSVKIIAEIYSLKSKNPLFTDGKLLPTEDNVVITSMMNGSGCRRHQ